MNWIGDLIMNRNGKKLITAVAFGIVFLIILSTMIVGENPQRSLDETLTSLKVANGPVLDGDSGDSVWSEAEFITTSNGVNIKSVFTDSKIYFLLTWSDSTQSDTKSQWSFSEGEWDKSGDEDRVALFWNMGNVANFDSEGCQILCHLSLGGVTSRDVMKTNGDTEKGDMWHWKAARTDAVGYIDDKWMNNDEATEEEWAEDEHDAMEAAHHGDSKDTGSYSDNKQKLDNSENEITVPKYYEPAATGADARFITAEEVANGEAKLITGVDLDGVLTYSGGIVPSDAKIPGYILEKPVGSRGDINVASNYADGKWTIEISRALNTNHDDDVQFTNTDKSAAYYFGVAVFDDSGGTEHITTGSNSYKLVFKIDVDGDGVDDSDDDFPNDPSETKDTDDDGVGDNSDEFPDDASETEDTDSDGVGDNSDAFPNNASETKDTDDDSVGDNTDAFINDSAASIDADNDGYPDQWNVGKTEADSTTGLKLDAFPNDPAKWKKSEKKDDDSTPGFELFTILLALGLVIVLYFNRKNRN
jgi:hypothetical protein